MATSFYVDGQNLFYGCLRGTTYQWLDLAAFCGRSLPGRTIGRIHYFTARLSVPPTRQDIADAQNTWLEALEADARIDLHFGRYRPGQTQEKGSDVNLACQLLMDAYEKACDEFAVISNDEDLATPVRLVRDKFEMPITVLHPCLLQNRDGSRRRRCVVLREAASESRFVLEWCVVRSQLPAVITVRDRTITKPADW